MKYCMIFYSDLGQHLRDQVKVFFPKGESSKIADPEECLKRIESLERIANNFYGKKYPTNCKTTATGLTPEQCAVANTTEFMQALEQNKLGFFGQLKEKFKDLFSRSSDSSSK